MFVFSLVDRPLDDVLPAAFAPLVPRVGVLTIFPLGFGFSADAEMSQRPGRAWGEKLFGSDTAKRREN